MGPNSKTQLLVETKRIRQTKFSGRLEGVNEDMPGKANNRKAGFVISIADKVESKVK